MREPTIPSERHCVKGYQPSIPVMAKLIRETRQETTYPDEFLLEDRRHEQPPEIKHIGPAYVPFANEFAYFMDYTGQSYGHIHEGDWCKSKDFTLADVLTGHAMRPAAGLRPTRVELLRAYYAAGFSPQFFCANPQDEDYMSLDEMKDSIRYALYVLKQPAILPVSLIRWEGSMCNP